MLERGHSRTDIREILTEEHPNLAPLYECIERSRAEIRRIIDAAPPAMGLLFLQPPWWELLDGDALQHILGHQRDIERTQGKIADARRPHPASTPVPLTVSPDA